MSQKESSAKYRGGFCLFTLVLVNPITSSLKIINQLKLETGGANNNRQFISQPDRKSNQASEDQEKYLHKPDEIIQFFIHILILQHH